MSRIVKFFVSTRLEVTDSALAGPSGSIPTALFGNFDAEEAVIEWEAHLTGLSFERLVGEGVPEVVAEDEEGPLLFRLSDSLLEALGPLSEEGVEELARWWVEEKADEGVQISLPTALDILQQLRGLILRCRNPGEGVYCWTS